MKFYQKNKSELERKSRNKIGIKELFKSELCSEKKKFFLNRKKSVLLKF